MKDLNDSKPIFNGFKGNQWNYEKSLLYINSTNLEYIKGYLAEVRKRSHNSYYNHKSVLRQFFLYFKKPIIINEEQNIFMWDLIDYFNEIMNPREVLYCVKKNETSILRRFFNYVIKITLPRRIMFSNPVPSDDIYKFEITSKDFKKKSEKDKKKLRKEDILRILEYSKLNFRESKKLFIFYALCICTGARFSEIRTIKIEDLNLERRFFETGIELNARKSTYRTGDSLIFFFPERIKPYLKNYILSITKYDTKWLFPYRKDISKSMKVNQVIWSYQRIRNSLGIYFSMHYFRHSMISHLKSNGCSLEDREMLLNHSPSSTQGKHYEHDEIKEMREIYDKYFPYYSFPYF